MLTDYRHLFHFSWVSYLEKTNNESNLIIIEYREDVVIIMGFLLYFVYISLRFNAKKLPNLTWLEPLLNMFVNDCNVVTSHAIFLDVLNVFNEKVSFFGAILYDKCQL